MAGPTSAGNGVLVAVLVILGVFLAGGGGMLFCCCGLPLLTSPARSPRAGGLPQARVPFPEDTNPEPLHEVGTVVPNAPRQPPPPEGRPGKTTVDLIPFIDPRKDSVHGKWLVHENVLHCNDQHFVPRIQIPYRPPEEYDFVVTFSQPALRNGISLVMPKPGGDGWFFWHVGGAGGSIGFGTQTEAIRVKEPTKPNRVYHRRGSPAKRRSRSARRQRTDEVRWLQETGWGWLEEPSRFHASGCDLR